MKIIKEELNIRGVGLVKKLITKEEAFAYNQKVLKYQSNFHNKYTVEKLSKIGMTETVLDLGSYGGIFYDLIENKLLNNIVNSLLNEKAVIHSYNAIITNQSDKSNMVGHDFHIDQPYYNNCRTSIIVMIPLVTFNASNGSTQFVPHTHHFRKKPSRAYLNKYYESSEGSAGDAIVIDSSTWHRAGANISNNPRAMIVIKYTLAPFKQQIDYCISNKKNINKASNLVKQRLGWDARVPLNYKERIEPNVSKKKFKSGQYDMKNVYYN